jgi:hypothetical protein
MFGLSLLNGWGIFLGGSALIAAPIIIHFLSKRKFRVVDWAAIDFLLEADRRNRRRIRMENLLLLLLRCLAVILIALLVARPRLHAAGFVAGALKTAGIDRIVVLDDSLSMAAADGNRTPFAAATQSLQAFAEALSREHSSDTLTVILTSQPDGPFPLDRKPVAGAGAEVAAAVHNLHPTDLSARLIPALTTVQKRLAVRDAPNRRVVYIASDLRRRDWQAPADLPEDKTAPGLVRLLAERADGLFIVDVGSEPAGSNLVVTDIAPADKALIAGVETAFDATVVNRGRSVENDVPVLLYADNAVPQRQTIPALEPGQSVHVPFTCTFRQPGSVALRAVADRPGVLPVDKTARLYPASVAPAVPVLLVDGNPVPERGLTDSFFLRTALASRGPYRTGYSVSVVGEDEFERASLDDFQAVFLCNCSCRHLSPERLRGLAEFVRAGGGLAVFLGDNVDPGTYNQLLCTAQTPATQPDPARLARGGDEGLLPARLLEKCGDPELGAKFVGLSVENATHPVFGLLAGSDNPFLSAVKFYRWWGVEPDAPSRDAHNPPVILARFTDDRRSPAVIEKSFGAGRVVMFTTSPNAAWHNWPGDTTGSFPATMLALARYLERRTTGQGLLTVGQTLTCDVDTTRYKGEAELFVGSTGDQPGALRIPARPADPADPRRALVQFDQAGAAGFYLLRLTPYRFATGVKDQLFAANIDPTETDLTRTDLIALRQKVGAKVVFLKGQDSLVSDAVGAGTEIWRQVLLALAAVLCVEQGLAFAFGRKR